jgi:hypothetical protein
LQHPDRKSVSANEDDRKYGKQDNGDKDENASLTTLRQHVVVVGTAATHTIIPGYKANLVGDASGKEAYVFNAMNPRAFFVKLDAIVRFFSSRVTL